MDNDMLLDLLVASESILDRELEKFGVQHRGVDRWHAAFKVVRVFRDQRKKAIEDGLSVVPGYTGEAATKLYQAMYDCWEVAPSLRGLDSEDPKIVRDKLRKLLRGPVGRAKSAGAAPGRDTLFELTVLAELKGGGMDARLVEPNPDIQAIAPGGTYHIECKRINGYTLRAFAENLHNASKQVVAHLPEGHRGVLAVSLTDYITQGELLLVGKTEADIDGQIQEIQKRFCEIHQTIWEDPNFVDPRIVGMMFYCSYLATLDGEPIPYNQVYPFVVPSGTAPDAEVLAFIQDTRLIQNPANGERSFQTDHDVYIPSSAEGLL